MRFRPFLIPSVDFSSEVTRLFDSVWPCVAAMWNLRWQVRGFMAEHPRATQETLKARFVEGSGLHGANIYRACCEYTWVTQQQFFAEVVLVNLFAHYEAWCSEIAELFGVHVKTEKALQFWGMASPPNATAPTNISDALRLLTAQKATALADSFGSQYLNSVRYSGNRLEALLRCLRVFKEMRNCLSHDGGLVSDNVIARYKEWLPFATSTQMGVREVPKCAVPVKGSPCLLELRGVVALGDVLTRIVATVDAELIQTAIGEASLVSRWKDGVGQVRVKSNRSDLRSKVRGAAERLGMLKPEVTQDLTDFLKSNGMILFH